ncbi:hypothetical protein R1sor_018552 [Riccia sorocarpa]|uniref:Glycine-rich protein n=1 Tax=Riccia sorocarpa TaxID=122646 RepID=A0ABD3IA08_9MARC
MAYISRGEVTSKRSPWRLSIISETFWAIVNLVIGFVMTMFSMDAASSYGKKKPTKRVGGLSGGGPPGFGGGGPGGPGGRPGGGGSGPRGGFGGLSNVRGVDHTAPAPSCGSCCGG